MKRTNIAFIGIICVVACSCAEKEPLPDNGTDPQLCGNNVVDPGEDCDGSNLDGMKCEDLGYYAGDLACLDDCSFDVSNCHYCGDGIVQEEYGEKCDDGVNDGVYGCMADCSDFAPAYCGDGIIQEEHEEQCEAGKPLDLSCEDLDFLGGNLECGADCKFDTSGCIAAFSCGDVFVDPRDENEYQTVEIGDLCWFAKNLDVGVRVDTDDTQSDQNLIQKYCYENKDSMCEIYGGLYRWPQAMDYSEEPRARGICPEGWWIPGEEDWKKLEISLALEIHKDMSPEEAEELADKLNDWRFDDLGTALKEGGSSGFEAPMSGRINSNSSWSLLGGMGFWWTSTISALDDPDNPYPNNPLRRCLHATWDTVGKWDSFPGTYGFSLRCVTDTF